MLLKIKDWSTIYENNRTRELKHMAWLPLPNRQDGDGYTELLDHENGAAHFGAWTAMVQVASRCDPRGTLVREGGRPHDSASLSRMSRIRQSVFDEAIPRLISIGWLTSEVVVSSTDTTLPHEGAVKPHEGAVKSHVVAKNGTERNGTEIHTPKAPRGAVAEDQDSDSTPGFEKFWAAWPKGERKLDRAGCLRKWKRKNLELQTPAILSAVERWKGSRAWAEGFDPMPGTWLNQSRWEATDIEPATGSGSSDAAIGIVETRDPTEAELAMFTKGGT